MQNTKERLRLIGKKSKENWKVILKKKFNIYKTKILEMETELFIG